MCPSVIKDPCIYVHGRPVYVQFGLCMCNPVGKPHSAHHNLHTLHTTLHTLCTLHSAHHTPHTKLGTLRTPHSAHHTLHTTLCTPYILCTLSTPHSSHHTPHTTPCTLCTSDSAHLTLHNQHTLHTTLQLRICLRVCACVCVRVRLRLIKGGRPPALLHLPFLLLRIPVRSSAPAVEDRAQPAHGYPRESPGLGPGISARLASPCMGPHDSVST